MGETLLNLPFETETIIPLEVGLSSPRVKVYNKHRNKKDLRVNLDLLEEVQDGAWIQMATDQWCIAHYFNTHVKVKQFQPGELIFWKVAVSQPIECRKLSPN